MVMQTLENQRRQEEKREIKRGEEMKQEQDRTAAVKNIPYSQS